jgi:transcriptional regulator with XRE-family HTH domain
MSKNDYEEAEAEAVIGAQIERISTRLRDERRSAGISQMELSFKAGLSQNQVNCIETGKRIPNLYTILKVCHALNINPSVLFNAGDQERQEARETIMKLVAKYV